MVTVNTCVCASPYKDDSIQSWISTLVTLYNPNYLLKTLPLNSLVLFVLWMPPTGDWILTGVSEVTHHIHTTAGVQIFWDDSVRTDPGSQENGYKIQTILTREKFDFSPKGVWLCQIKQASTPSIGPTPNAERSCASLWVVRASHCYVIGQLTEVQLISQEQLWKMACNLDRVFWFQNVQILEENAEWFLYHF